MWLSWSPFENNGDNFNYAINYQFNYVNKYRYIYIVDVAHSFELMLLAPQLL